MFQLVFRGECVPGTDLQAAKDSAKTLFKANVDQIERMFSGQAVVIRNKLEEVQAEKYRAVLKKHGMVAYVEPMEGTEKPAATAKPAPPPARPEAKPSPSPSASQPSPQPSSQSSSKSAPQSAGKPASPVQNSGGSVAVEPGDRLPVAGEKVDNILSGSGLTLDPVGVTLEEHIEHEAPMFEHLDDWTIAPPGTELVEEKHTPPPVVPDVSHLSLADEDQQDGR